MLFTNYDFNPLLLPDERLQWDGKPVQGFYFKPKDWFLTLFSLFCLGFSIFWVFFASSIGGGLFGLFGVPFILVGMYMLFGRFFWDIHTRKNTYYAVTNQRIIIVTGVFTQQVQSFAIKNSQNIRLNQSKDGRGTIHFGNDTQTGYGEDSRIVAAPTFEEIEEVARVYQIIVKYQA